MKMSFKGKGADLMFKIGYLPKRMLIVTTLLIFSLCLASCKTESQEKPDEISGNDSADNPTSSNGVEDELVNKLSSTWWETFHRYNYDDLCSRQDETGFFKESVSGGYMLGYWPRTGGALTKLWLNSGEYDRVEKLLKFTLDVTKDGRIPHIITPAAKVNLPVEGSDLEVHIDASVPLYRLDEPHSAAQPFKASDKPVIAVEVSVSSGAKGKVHLTICSELDGKAIGTATKEGQFLDYEMTRFEFSSPLKLDAGKQYYIQMKWEGEGTLVWAGNNTVVGNTLGGSIARDTGKGGAWLFKNTNSVTAFAIDTGSLKHSIVYKQPLAYSMMDQIDGQAHIILSWALYAQKAEGAQFSDSTYKQVAALMNSTLSSTYMQSSGKFANLVLNKNLEHHREVRFWNTYDILTQSFVAESLREMIAVANIRKDTEIAKAWTEKLEKMEAAINQKMVWEVDGKKIYAEMLNEDLSGEAFDGLSWINLAITASGWTGFDEEIYNNTIKTYAEKATFIWKGHKVLGVDYTKDQTQARSAIGKGVGWEMLYYAQRGDWERVDEILDFVFDAHEGIAERRYGEAMHMPTATAKIVHQDPGNGEQTAWFIYCLSEVRRLKGLDPIPAKK